MCRLFLVYIKTLSIIIQGQSQANKTQLVDVKYSYNFSERPFNSYVFKVPIPLNKTGSLLSADCGPLQILIDSCLYKVYQLYSHV
jgi:hypothetical protein